MLAAARRSVLLGRRRLAPAASILFSTQFVVGSSKDLDRASFSTTCYARDGVKTRPTKAALAEKAKKLEKKRSLRAVRKIEDDAREVLARESALQKRDELDLKRIASEELSEGLDPFTDAELEVMYQGLIAAPPTAFSALELPEPEPILQLGEEFRVGTREERLDALETRLSTIDLSEREQGEDEAVERIEASDLASRLQARRDPLPQEEEEDYLPPTPLAVTPLTPAHQLLNKLEALVQGAESVAQFASANATAPSFEVPLGIAVRSEWQDIALACAQDDDMEGVKKVFQLMKRSGVPSDGNLLSKVMEDFAARGKARECLALAQHAKDQNLPLSVTTHHHLISSLLPSHPIIAIGHLHSLEGLGYTPLLETYTLLIRSLVSPASPPHLVVRGWDLYAHTRLVAHPTPDVPLFSAMIHACATGPNPSPERAIDLFTEMTADNRLPPSEEAYNGVIRACAREGTQEYYFEALRFMRMMLDNNISPSRFTFHSLLEGAKRHGDLARARWMLVKMIGLGGAAAPDSSSMGLVFQTYSTYKPPLKNQGHPTTSSSDTQASESTSATLDPTVIPAPTTETAAVANIPPPTNSVKESILDNFDEFSLFYPGPLPETTLELLVEAHNLMSQCVGSSAVTPPASTPVTQLRNLAPIEPSPIFTSVHPSPFLLNAYLELLCAHAPSEHAIRYFDTAYDQLQVAKNRFTYERVMVALESVKNRTVATAKAKSVFQEWQTWVESLQAEEVEPLQSEDESLGQQVAVQGTTSGRNISKMWASMIRVLARNFEDQTGLRLLQSFIAAYPPANILEHSHSLRAAIRSLPAQPSPVRLSDSIYPETRSSARLDKPPYILYDDIKILHLRLANVEDKKGLGIIKGICKAYEGALRAAKEYDENKIRITAAEQQAQVVLKASKRLAAAERRARYGTKPAYA